jgi:hypothetical protein
MATMASLTQPAKLIIAPSCVNPAHHYHQPDSKFPASLKLRHFPSSSSSAAMVSPARAAAASSRPLRSSVAVSVQVHCIFSAFP